MRKLLTLLIVNCLLLTACENPILRELLAPLINEMSHPDPDDTHLDSDPIEFTDTADNITIIYGDNNNSFNNKMTDAHNGTGAITYSSSNPTAVAVDNDGVVTILGAGTTVITAQKEADDVYARANANYTLTVNPRPLTITPNAGQSKVFGANDPVFSYTASEALISGNSFSGALSYAGSNVGTYPFTLGTFSAGSNYTLSLSGNVNFEITKAAGADVGGAPAVSGQLSQNSIAVNAVGIPNNFGNQTVEYAINTTDTLPAAGWQNDTTFGSLTPGSYYVFARSAENSNCYAGTASISAPVILCRVVFDSRGGSSAPEDQIVLSGGKVTEPADPAMALYNFAGWYSDEDLTIKWNFETDTVAGNITLYADWIAFVEQAISITFAQITEGAPELNNEAVIIYRSSANGITTKPFTLDTPTQYSSYIWYVNGIQISTAASFTLDSSDNRYNIIGTHSLTLEVLKDGMPYNATITFEVRQ